MGEGASKKGPKVPSEAPLVAPYPAPTVLWALQPHNCAVAQISFICSRVSVLVDHSSSLNKVIHTVSCLVIICQCSARHYSFFGAYFAKILLLKLIPSKGKWAGRSTIKWNDLCVERSTGFKERSTSVKSCS